MEAGYIHVVRESGMIGQQLYDATITGVLGEIRLFSHGNSARALNWRAGTNFP
jgi:hypothetical protein